MMLATDVTELVQMLRTYLPLLPLVLLIKYLVQAVITFVQNLLTSDLYFIPSPPIPVWKRYTIGHNLLYHILRADALDTAALFNAWRKEHGPVFQIASIFGERCVFITSDAAIREVHVAQQSSFIKAVSTRKAISSVVGENGILLAEGSAHSRLRRAVSPAMHHDALTKVGDVFIRQGKQLSRHLLEMADSGGDVLREVRVSTFLTIFEACLGKNAATPEVVSKLQDAYLVVFPEPPLRTLMNSVLHTVFWFVDQKRFSYREDLKEFIRTTIRDICAEHVRKCQDGSREAEIPLVSLMVDEDTRKNITSDEMVETVLSFLVAGQATTSMSICWTLYILARDPDWQDRLHEEVQKWSEEDGMDGLNRLPLLDRAVKESIRLYPPVFFTTRKSKEPVVIDGYTIPKDTVLRVPVLAVHRNEEIWGTDASEFNPDRFSRDEVVASTKMYWCPFSFGMRGCIGQRFAILEIKAFVTEIILHQKVSVKPLEDAAPSCVGPFAIPRGLKLYFEKR